MDKHRNHLVDILEHPEADSLVSDRHFAPQQIFRLDRTEVLEQVPKGYTSVVENGSLLDLQTVIRTVGPASKVSSFDECFARSNVGKEYAKSAHQSLSS